MTFKSAYLKLTIYYVLIVLTISVVFSVVIYKMSSSEINRGLRRQMTVFRQLPHGAMVPEFDIDFEKIRADQLKVSLNHLVDQLIYFNIAILIISAFGSYFLAKKTLEPIEEMVKAQNDFTADASHELKTPLAAMKAEIEVNLRDKKLSIDQAKNMLKSNLEEIERLESLSNALLKLARFQNDVKINFQKFPVETIIIDAYEKIASLADKKNITFNNQLQNFEVTGDKQSLTELFVILLDNAIKYSPNKSEIHINIQKEKDVVSVEIIDEGIGIKASDLPHIFDRFYRADSSRSKENIAGYGLGLSIAKRIVQLHSAKIFVKSEISKGTEFIVKFPPADL